jgi:hypothetical protein
LSIFAPDHYLSENVLLEGELFPTYFFGLKIRPSLITLKDGLKTQFGWSVILADRIIK